MTQNEMDKEVQRLNEIRKVRKLDNNELSLAVEISCREMINSCLCYDNDFFFIFSDGKSYAKQFINFLGLKKVKEIYEDQKRDFLTRAHVERAVFEDPEKNLYNHIVWDDEKDGKIANIEK